MHAFYVNPDELINNIFNQRLKEGSGHDSIIIEWPLFDQSMLYALKQSWVGNVSGNDVTSLVVYE